MKFMVSDAKLAGAALFLVENAAYSGKEVGELGLFSKLLRGPSIGCGKLPRFITPNVNYCGWKLTARELPNGACAPM